MRILVAVGLCMSVLAGCTAVTSPSESAASPAVSPTPFASRTSAASPTAAPFRTPAASGATTTLPLEPIDRDAVLAEPEAVAGLLADPSRRGDGVVSLLASLGIGIYTPDGHQILQGSESSSDDFFLYDFEVPLLESMAGAGARPFLELHDVFASAGYTGSPAELALGFATAFGGHPDA